MSLSTNPINSYQTNQNLAGWVQQTEAMPTIGATSGDSESALAEEVTLSNRREIFDWVASQLPLSGDNQANLSRVSQQLHEYQILSIRDLSTLNHLSALNPDEDLLAQVDIALNKTESYQGRQTLSHLKQVFSTLNAAEFRPAA